MKVDTIASMDMYIHHFVFLLRILLNRFYQFVISLHASSHFGNLNAWLLRILKTQEFLCFSLGILILIEQQQKDFKKFLFSKLKPKSGTLTEIFMLNPHIVKILEICNC